MFFGRKPIHLGLRTRMAETINQLLDRLAAYHDQMRRFTADASHEMRGPLAAMRAAVDVVLQQPRTADDYRDVLSSLGEQCERLTALVNALLLLAKTDSGQVELNIETVDLAFLVGDVVDTYLPLAEDRGIALSFHSAGPVVFRGDAGRMRQLASNLIDNALKFTNTDGHVTVSVENGKGVTRLTVLDTGVGIHAQELPHIFERFYQADAARSGGGVGLGLSICRWIVEAHGGQISATSDKGQGTGFVVDFPHSVRTEVGEHSQRVATTK
jgi:signal transduction histidine kinase